MPLFSGTTAAAAAPLLDAASAGGREGGAATTSFALLLLLFEEEEEEVDEAPFSLPCPVGPSVALVDCRRWCREGSRHVLRQAALGRNPMLPVRWHA